MSWICTNECQSMYCWYNWYQSWMPINLDRECIWIFCPRVDIGRHSDHSLLTEPQLYSALIYGPLGMQCLSKWLTRSVLAQTWITRARHLSKLDKTQQIFSGGTCDVRKCTNDRKRGTYTDVMHINSRNVSMEMKSIGGHGTFHWVLFLCFAENGKFVLSKPRVARLSHWGDIHNHIKEKCHLW